MDAVARTGSQSDQSILQNLPAEILALIFEDPVTSDVTATLARAIRPFTRANRYRKLDITYSKFIKLCELIQGSLEIAGLVVELRLSDCYRYRVREEIPLFDFFRSATSLKILEIENSTDFPARLLSAKFIFACYSSLTHLKFLSYSNSAATLSYQFRNLCFIPRLEYLSIAWECDAEEAKYDEVEGVALQWEEESLTLHTAGIFTLPESKLKALSLQARRLDSDGVAKFVARFPELEELSLLVDEEDVDLGPVLAAVTRNLRRLRIDVPDDSELAEDPGQLSIELRLENNVFALLERLTLFNDLYSEELPHDLTKLKKLQSLEFRHAPPYATLRQLLTGPRRIANLKRLVINGREYEEKTDSERGYSS